MRNERCEVTVDDSAARSALSAAQQRVDDLASASIDAARSGEPAPHQETVEGIRALVVPVEGPLREVVLTDRAGSHLAEFRRHTGSEWIEHVRGPLDTSLWVDEEGALDRLRSGMGDNPVPRRPNTRIDMLLQRSDGWSIRGDVVITGGTGPEGDATSLPAHTIAFLGGLLAGVDATVDGTLTPEAGRCYLWTAPAQFATAFDGADETLHVKVECVADDGAWADIVVTQRGGGQWAKRQPLGALFLVPTDMDVDAFLHAPVGGE